MKKDRAKASESTRGSMVLWVLLVFVVGLVFWANTYEIQQSSRASAQVIPPSRVQVIQASSGGVLDQIFVKEGDRVVTGQPLARLDRTSFEASVEELQARVAHLSAVSSRLRAEVLGESELRFGDLAVGYPEVVGTQKKLFVQRTQGKADELRTLERALELARSEVALVKKLADLGDLVQSELIRVQMAENEAEAQLVRTRNRFLEDATAELAKTEDELRQNLEVLKQRQEQLDQTLFTARVDGIVKNVRATTAGAVLRTGEEILQIIPTADELILEARLPPSEIAGLRPGLPARIRFDAYDFTVFGSVNGELSYVSADTLTEQTPRGEQTYYLAYISVQSNPVRSQTGRELEIMPGMTATVDVETGSRSVANYLLKPLNKTLTEAFTER